MTTAKKFNNKKFEYTNANKSNCKNQKIYNDTQCKNDQGKKSFIENLRLPQISYANSAKNDRGNVPNNNDTNNLYKSNTKSDDCRLNTNVVNKYENKIITYKNNINFDINNELPKINKFN